MSPSRLALQPSPGSVAQAERPSSAPDARAAASIQRSARGITTAHNLPAGAVGSVAAARAAVPPHYDGLASVIWISHGLSRLAPFPQST